jgi:hypothetical protein
VLRGGNKLSGDVDFDLVGVEDVQLFVQFAQHVKRALGEVVERVDFLEGVRVDLEMMRSVQ